MPVLTAQGWKVEVREKREKGEAGEIARTMADDGFDPIVNCGGDGTMNEIVDALAGTGVAVGVLPGGTANVWPQQVGVSLRSRVAATQLVHSIRAQMDLGRVRISGTSSHHFLMMAGMGADGAVMKEASRRLKNRIGALAVGIAALRAVPHLTLFPVEIEVDGVQWRGEISEMIVGNTRDYGGFTRVTADAYVDDGLLDVCLFTTRGVIGTARQMTSLLLHQTPSETSSETYRAASITLRSDRPLPLQVDGSDVDVPGKGTTEYHFEALPSALHVLIPRTYDGAMFIQPPHAHAHGKKGQRG